MSIKLVVNKDLWP